MLVSKGIAESHFNDMLFEWLGTLGFTQPHINDRQLAFWVAGAPITSQQFIVDGDFPDLTNWTTLPSSSISLPVAGTVQLNTLVNGARRGGIAVTPGGSIFVSDGQQYAIECTVVSASLAIRPITIGMSDNAGTTDRITIDGITQGPVPHTIRGIWDVTITETIRPVMYTNFGNTLFSFRVQNFSMRRTN
jgi:hypothetical protein